MLARFARSGPQSHPSKNPRSANEDTVETNERNDTTDCSALPADNANLLFTLSQPLIKNTESGYIIMFRNIS